MISCEDKIVIRNISPCPALLVWLDDRNVWFLSNFSSFLLQMWMVYLSRVGCVSTYLQIWMINP